MEEAIGGILLLGLFLAIPVVYFLPTIVAYSRRYVERKRVLLINLLAGWTFLGWIIAMVMAFGANVEDASA